MGFSGEESKSIPLARRAILVCGLAAAGRRGRAPQKTKGRPFPRRTREPAAQFRRPALGPVCLTLGGGALCGGRSLFVGSAPPRPGCIHSSFSESPSRVPVYLVVTSFPPMLRVTEKVTALPSTLPSEISVAPRPPSRLPVSVEPSAFKVKVEVVITVPALLFPGPLAADVRRHNGECQGAQNRNYKKQLFGHSTGLGVTSTMDVTTEPQRGLSPRTTNVRFPASRKMGNFPSAATLRSSQF